MRLFKERAQYGPLEGRYRIFLIDHLDRANEQAANSLLKMLEEPPAYLLILMTAENAYDLLPTIRSRSLILSDVSACLPRRWRSFMRDRGLKDTQRRIALSGGSPGVAACLDLDAYDKRRSAMISLLQAASGVQPFAAWAKVSESLGRTDKLEHHLNVLYTLLEDVLFLQNGSRDIRNVDVRRTWSDCSHVRVSTGFECAVAKIDELVEFLRRNIQKSIALDALSPNCAALNACGKNKIPEIKWRSSQVTES